MAIQRTRQRDSIVDFPVSYRYASYPVSCTNRTLGSWTTVNGTLKAGIKKTTSDYVTPHYHRLKALGLLGFSFNPFGSIERTYQISGGSGYRSTSNSTICTPPSQQYTEVEGPNVFGLVFKNYIGGQPEAVPTFVDQHHKLAAEVWTRCLAKRVEGEANYLESLAELDQAWHMVGSPLENIRRFNAVFAREKDRKRKELLKRLRPRGKPARRLRMQRELAKALAAFLSAEWLRYRYGINPLISDVKAALKVLKKNYKDDPGIHTARARGVVQDVKFNLFSTPVGSYTWNWTRADTQWMSIRAQFTDEYSCEPWQDLGLTFHNLVGVAWELTHFSFVVDWFVNVGDLIYANVPRIGVRALGGGTTHKQLISSYYFCRSITEPTSTITGVPGDTMLCKVEETVRTPKYWESGGELVVRDNFKLGGFKRATDAITLIVQQLGRLRF